MDKHDRLRVAGRFVFGDYFGLAIFLGCLFLFGVTGRLERLITDSDTVFNVVYNLGHGQLALVERPFGNLTPGTVTVDGVVFGRNYGQAALAVPIYWLVELLSPLVTPRQSAITVWTAASGAFAWVLWHLTDDRRVPAGVVGFVSILLVAGGLVNPGRGSGASSAEVALVASTTVAGAVCCVLVYRLVADVRGRRVGVLAASCAAVATPIWVWSLWPKRHMLVGALVLGSMYGLARSRTATDRRRYIAARASAYVCVGLLSWIHAAEAFAVLLVLLAIDLPTAPRNDGRTLAAVAVVFGVSLLPTLVTNTLIAGHPFEPPRLLSGYTESMNEEAAIGAPGGDSGGSSGGGSGGGSSGGGGIHVVLPSFVTYPLLFVEQYATGIDTILDNPGQLTEIFLLSSEEVDIGAWNGQNLSVLESAPVLGLVGAAIGGWIRRMRTRAGVPGSVTLFGLLVVASYLLMYVQRLPLHAQFTVRYLFPVFPVALVLAFRNFDAGDILLDEYKLIGAGYAATTIVVAIGILAITYMLRLTEGQALTVHAAINVSLAVLWFLVALVLGATDRGRSVFALGFGVTAGAGTALYLAITSVYFHWGASLLPAVEAVTFWLFRLVFRF